MKKEDILKLLGSVMLCEGFGVFGSIFTVQSIPTWYADLIKPSFNPPDCVFAPVWITLYFLMGVSLFLVIRGGVRNSKVREAVLLFFTQLALNVLWTAIFFGLRAPLAALIEIVLLFLAISVTAIRFYTISRLAGILLIPYLVWVGFAAVLNLSILILNS
jgi:translocator protein